MTTTRIKPLLLWGMIMTFCCAHALAQADPRSTALAAWYLGDGIGGREPALSGVGSIAYNQTPAGIGARPDRRAALLTGACFNAGDALNVSGDQLTLFLRLQIPSGEWNSGLFSKRGSHATLSYNLFCADLAGTDGPDIGFELNTASGFTQISFPVSRINPAAWHNLAARYDGAKIQLFCDDRLMASAAASGAIHVNAEPALIGAETDDGSIVRELSGYVEEAVLWARALSDSEVGALQDHPAPTAYPSAALHYRPDEHDVGDVHPRFINGQWIVTYLYYDGSSYQPVQIRSRDMLHWQEWPLRHAPVSGSDELANWYPIEYVWDPALACYRSVWGYDGMRSSVSSDLINWSAASPQVLLANPGIYQRFSDPSICQTGPADWQMLITMAKPGMPIESAGSIGWATSSDLRNWTFRGDLYYPGGQGVPEVPTLFQLGGKWYLLASWYDGGVGRPTYQVADSPSGPFTALPSNALDGKDLCAAVSDSDGARRLLFGWIPLTAATAAGSQHWGGASFLPSRNLSNFRGRASLPFPGRFR